jgi:pimeloyl-ACP methyl ester carboxylesterase
MTLWQLPVVAATLVAAGCTGVTDNQSDAGQTVKYASAACPADISAVIVADVTCGYLTVPENRDRPESDRTIKLLVTRIQPPEPATVEPMFVAGTDLGTSSDYGGIAPLAQRVGREVVLLAPRGTAYSVPALECPEVEQVGDSDLANPTNDPVTRARFLDAVSACYRRLSDAGTDLSAYNLSEMAADAEDLRQALDVDTWNVITYGTASRIAMEMLRIAPDPIRTITLDSPELPGSDPRVVAVEGTRDAIAAVLEACADDSTCSAQYPEVRGSFDRALTAVDSKPVTLTLADQPPDGRTVSVHIDSAMLVRMVRQMLSEGAGLRHPRAVPRTLEAVLAGRTDELVEISTAFVDDGPYCNGYQTRCVPLYHRALGVVFSTLCHDIAPFADPTAPARVAGTEIGFDAAYGRSPYLKVCDSWAVGKATGDVAKLVRSDVPVLAIIGAFGPYVRPDQAREGLGEFSNLSIVVAPTDGHNVVAKTDCMLNTRNAWVDDPAIDAADADCLTSARVAWDLR